MSINTYLKPFPNGLGIRKKPAPYHLTSPEMWYAIDFAMLVGTPILAAADGVVIRVQQRFRKNYNSPSPQANPNYIVIEHSNGEYSEYLHLKQYSCFVKSGAGVKAGQVIALSGETGYAAYPHLHFAVLDRKRISMPIRFQRSIKKEK